MPSKTVYAVSIAQETDKKICRIGTVFI